MSRAALLASSAIAVLLSGPAFAADAAFPPRTVVVPALPRLPAVSALNGKIGAFGGPIDNINGWGVFGALSVPLHDHWGAQIDGLGGSAGGDSFWGVAGHAFWRDPRYGLLGLYASNVDFSGTGAQVSKVGVEGQLYLGSWTVEASLSQQGGSFKGTTGNATLAVYLTDNFRLDGTVGYLQGIGNTGGFGAEWQLHNGLALFANASWGNSYYKTVLGGVKLYLGPDKSLIRRQREDDPGIYLPMDLFHCGREGGKFHSFDGLCFLPSF